LADAALVAGGTEVSAFAGEGEAAAAEEGTDNGEGIGAERTHGGTVAFLV
jgi:hypothetical protein